MKNKELIEISIGEINNKDRTFSLSYPLYPLPLASFIKETGFISPLILRRQKGNRRYQIVSGFKRAAILKKRSQGKIPAFIFSEKEMPDKKAILLSFYENLSHRQFNEIEKALAIEKLFSLGKIPEERLINFFLPLLGLPRSKKYLDGYFALSGLEEPVKKDLVQGIIGVEVGIILAGFNPLVRKLFLRLIKRLKLNQNKTKEVITLLGEISRREDRLIPSLLREEPIRKVQNFSTLRDYLLNRRYPEFKAYEKNFLKLTKKLKLSSGIKIVPPPFFEDDKLKINLEVKEEKELEEILSSLNKAFKSKRFGEILSFL